MMWYIGLDWADTHHDVEVLDEAGKRVGAQRFAHSQAGLDSMKQFLLRIATSPENLACIVAHESWIAHYLSAGGRHPGLSRQPQNRQSVA